MLARFDLAGSAIITVAAGILALYFASTFEVSTLTRWLSGPLDRWHNIRARWKAARQSKRQAAIERAIARAAERPAKRNRRAAKDAEADSVRPRRSGTAADITQIIPVAETPTGTPADHEAPFDLADKEPSRETEFEIPIRTLEYQPSVRLTTLPGDEEPASGLLQSPHEVPVRQKRKQAYRLPSPALLNEVPPGSGYDGQELKEIASRIKSKLEEFNVRGSVVQINPGPVVTTFEYKPDAGIKYSRITTLNDDLCLGLQAESVLIERLPGKPTVGIEVPNSKREVISLRAILESDEFHESPSKMTIALGKDVNGR
ncbi:MAG: hypothetical protein JO210_10520, partial [Acidobacteriaceae bacterium]|nr:hypothetical protein [Acidobacteriaceae bacterium]